MAKNNRKRDLVQVKKSLKVLRDRGLYKPVNARAKPTKYSISLLKRFSDVVAGRAFVQKADKSTIAKLPSEIRERATRGRVVIPKVGTNTRPIITKEGEIIRRATFGSTRYRYRPLKLRDGEIPDLGPRQSYTVRIMEGRSPVQLSFNTREELIAAVTEYDTKNGRGFNMLQYVQIAEPEGNLRFKVYFIKEGSRRKTRIVRAAYEDMALDQFRFQYPEFADWIVTRIDALDT
jgi:hypothetical protein